MQAARSGAGSSVSTGVCETRVSLAALFVGRSSPSSVAALALPSALSLALLTSRLLLFVL